MIIKYDKKTGEILETYPEAYGVGEPEVLIEESNDYDLYPPDEKKMKKIKEKAKVKDKQRLYLMPKDVLDFKGPSAYTVSKEGKDYILTNKDDPEDTIVAVEEKDLIKEMDKYIKEYPSIRKADKIKSEKIRKDRENK